MNILITGIHGIYQLSVTSEQLEKKIQNNILITGIHGFVGSNLVADLKNKHTIYGLDIVAPQKEGVVKTYTWAELETIPSVDVVIHLAGKAHDTKNQTNAQV